MKECFVNKTSVLGVIDTNLDHATLASPTQRPVVNEYAELKKLIKQRGLLKKQPVYYTFKILYTVMLLAAGIAALFFIHNFWLQLGDAVFLAFVFGQIGFLGHDAGHRQIFHSTLKNDIIVMLQGNLLVGMSYTWWLDKHNQHHSHPNQFDMDPDIAIPAICFSQEDALSKRHFPRFLAKHQAYAFFPLLLLVGLDLQRSSILYLLRNKVKNRFFELSLLALHYILYFGLIFSQMNIWQGLVFILVHQTLSGLYLGSTFAPNHKGMLLLDKSSKMDFLRRQVLTARNVTSHPFNDFWYGGLNYQIEHHLFPSMPRKNLKEAQKIIRVFCNERSISYYETSMTQSYKEILLFLHHIGAPLRRSSITS